MAGGSGWLTSGAGGSRSSRRSGRTGERHQQHAAAAGGAAAPRAPLQVRLLLGAVRDGGAAGGGEVQPLRERDVGGGGGGAVRYAVLIAVLLLAGCAEPGEKPTADATPSPEDIGTSILHGTSTMRILRHEEMFDTTQVGSYCCVT